MTTLSRIAGALGMAPKREIRARESFTDQQISLISAAARGSNDVATACATIETAAGMFSTGFIAGGSLAAKLPDGRDYSDLVSTVWPRAGKGRAIRL